MSPAEIREELLSQHAGLRSRLEVVRLGVERWAKGEVPAAHMHRDLAGLVDALRSHNVLEETTLAALLRDVDAWGPTRVDIMTEAHTREHQDLFDALLAIGQAEDRRQGVVELERLRARLLEHMLREEETFLNTSVLRDDDVTVRGPRHE